MNNAIDKDINNFHKGFITTAQGGYEDPTYLGFRLVFDFDPSYRDPETLITDNSLFAHPNTDLDSAQRYLTAIGYPKRAEMLKEFKENLRYINGVTPWYWQTLDGLADIWKIPDGPEFTNYRGKDKAITITCNESIDLRITALADLYRKATFDPQTMRCLLPENLKYFTVTVQLAEMRKFHRLTKAAKDITLNSSLNNANLADIGSSYNQTFESIKDLISIMEFKLYKCEFDFNDSFPIEGAVSNGEEMVMAKQKFRIKTRKIKELNSYKLLDLILGEGPNESQFKPSSGKFSGANVSKDEDSFEKRVPDLDEAFNRSNPGMTGRIINGYASDIRNQIENIGASLINRQVNRLNEAINSRILGNVYGDLRNQTLEAIIGSFGKKTADGNLVFGNVFPQEVATKVKETFEDIYPNVPGKDSISLITKKIGNIYSNNRETGSSNNSTL